MSYAWLAFSKIMASCQNKGFFTRNDWDVLACNVVSVSFFKSFSYYLRLLYKTDVHIYQLGASRHVKNTCSL